MAITSEISHYSIAYIIRAGGAEISVRDTKDTLHLVFEAAHVIFDKADLLADIEMSALPDQEREGANMGCLLRLRDVLAAWQNEGSAQPSPEPTDLARLAQAIWTDLEKALSSAASMQAAVFTGDALRQARAIWLRSLPHDTPVLALGTPADFFEGNPNTTYLTGHIFKLHTNSGFSSLRWPDGSLWRDFRPDDADNDVMLATRENIASAEQRGYEFVLPDEADKMFQHAEIMRRLHGPGPEASTDTRGPDPEPTRIPSIKEWMAPFLPSGSEG